MKLAGWLQRLVYTMPGMTSWPKPMTQRARRKRKKARKLAHRMRLANRR